MNIQSAKSCSQLKKFMCVCVCLRVADAGCAPVSLTPNLLVLAYPPHVLYIYCELIYPQMLSETAAKFNVFLVPVEIIDIQDAFVWWHIINKVT